MAPTLSKPVSERCSKTAFSQQHLTSQVDSLDKATCIVSNTSSQTGNNTYTFPASDLLKKVCVSSDLEKLSTLSRSLPSTNKLHSVYNNKHLGLCKEDMSLSSEASKEAKIIGSQDSNSTMGDPRDPQTSPSGSHVVMSEQTYQKIPVAESPREITSPITSLSDRTKRRQLDLEKRARRAQKRLTRLQARQAQTHVGGQVREFIDHQHSTLQSIVDNDPNRIANGTMLLQPSNMIAMSTSNLVKLVQHIQTQAACSATTAQCRNNVGEFGGVLRLDYDTSSEISRVCSTLNSSLHHVERAIDSDATESESGGDSCDEDEAESTEEQFPKPSISQRAEYRWYKERCKTAARWTWLQAQVSDLEYRIRQLNDIHRQIRTAKGAVQLGNQVVMSSAAPTNVVATKDNTSSCTTATASTSHSLNGLLPSSTTPAVDDETCTAVRCRPVRSYYKRKLLHTKGLHLKNRKAARLSTIRCLCYPPVTPCILCSGRYNNCKTVEPYTMSLPEKMSVLSDSYHPVLSSSQDIPLSIYWEHVLRSGDVHNKLVNTVIQKPDRSYRLKSSRSIPNMTNTSTITSSSTEAGLGSPSVVTSGLSYSKKTPKRKLISTVTHKDKKNEMTKHRSQSVSLPAARQRSDSHTSTKELRNKARRSRILTRNAASQDSSLPNGAPTSSSSSLSQSCPSSSNFLKDMKKLRRHQDSAFDIDNIIIPQSFSAATRVEKLQYKEIVTPQWRIVGANDKRRRSSLEPNTHSSSSSSKASTSGRGRSTSPDALAEALADPRIADLTDDENVGMRTVIMDGAEQMIEDLSEEIIMRRHLRCEIAERKRFHSQLNIINNPSRRSVPSTSTGARSNHSRTNSADTALLDVEGEVACLGGGVGGGGDTLSAVSSGSSLAALADEDNILSGDVSAVSDSSSLKKARARSTSCSSDINLLSSHISLGDLASTPQSTPSRRPSKTNLTTTRTRSRSGSVTSDDPGSAAVQAINPGWPARKFPLTEREYHALVEPKHEVHEKRRPSRSSRRSVCDSVVGAGGGRRSVTPTSNASYSGYDDDGDDGDDPTDPEWTVAMSGDHNGSSCVGSGSGGGLVLRLSKR